LDFESEPGKGTTFRMLLPVAENSRPEINTVERLQNSST